MTSPFDSFAWRAFTESVSLAKVEVGDWIYTTPEPADSVLYGQLVQLERPQYAKGVARKVVGAGKHPEGGRQLVFEDGATIVPRNGTAAAYRFLLDDSGDPLPAPTYVTCPTCGSDGPSCVTSKGDSTGVHATRKKLPQQAWVGAASEKVEKILDDHDGCANCSHGFDAHYKTEQADGRACRVFTCQCKAWAKQAPVKGVDVVKGDRKEVAPAGRVADPERRALDTDRPDDEPIEGEPDTDGERCVTCKGFGLVRGQGKRAGERYKTLNGAQTAQANGNAVDCPECDGTGLIDLAA